MASVLSKVASSQASSLLPGETFTAAGVAIDRKPRVGLGIGDPKYRGVKVPGRSIWAATEKRLLIFSTAALGDAPKSLVLALELGPTARYWGMSKKEAREMTIAIEIDGARLSRTMARDDVKALAAAMQSAARAPSYPVPVDPYLGDVRTQHLTAALVAGDWPAAERMYEELGSAQARELLIGGGVFGEVKGHPPAFDQWVEARPGSAAARAIRGSHLVSWGWEARGSGYADSVKENAWELFHGRLRAAEEDLFAAAELDPSDALPWTGLLIPARGLSIPKEELLLRFEEAQRRQPGLVWAHLQTLQGLCKKWSGSHEDMFAFARSSAEAAPPGSPLSGLVATAHLERMMATDEAERSGYWGPDVRDELVHHARRSVLDPSWVDGAHGVPALNAFAAALDACGERELSYEIGRRIGTRRTTAWSFFGRAGVDMFIRCTTGPSA